MIPILDQNICPKWTENRQYMRNGPLLMVLHVGCYICVTLFAVKARHAYISRGIKCWLVNPENERVEALIRFWTATCFCSTSRDRMRGSGVMAAFPNGGHSKFEEGKIGWQEQWFQFNLFEIIRRNTNCFGGYPCRIWIAWIKY